MTWLFLHFSNEAATFRISTSSKKNPYLKYCCRIFLLWQLNYVWSALEEALLTFEQHCSSPSTPSLLLLFRFTRSKNVSEKVKGGFSPLKTPGCAYAWGLRPRMGPMPPTICIRRWNDILILTTTAKSPLRKS